MWCSSTVLVSGPEVPSSSLTQAIFFPPASPVHPAVIGLITARGCKRICIFFCMCSHRSLAVSRLLSNKAPRQSDSEDTDKLETPFSLAADRQVIARLV